MSDEPAFVVPDPADLVVIALVVFLLLVLFHRVPQLRAVMEGGA